MEKTREPVIQVKNLYKIFRVGTEKVRALNGVDLTIYRGEFCAIVGTSGSGKSTILKICLLMRATPVSNLRRTKTKPT